MKRCVDILLIAIPALMTVTLHAGPVCGAFVNTSLTLQADIGPCPADGLVINSGSGPIQINLNGHHITGSGVGSGLNIGLSSAITVVGPGQIQGFANGVSIQNDNTVVFSLTLTNNVTGVAINESQGVRVVGNVIQGNAQSQNGITTGNSGNVFLYRNTILGHPVAGIQLYGESETTADANTISKNGAGILAGPADLVCYTLRGNVITQNAGNGIDATPRRSASRAQLAMAGTCFDIEDNVANSNAASGIVLEADSALGSVLVQDNATRNNLKNGISLMGGQNSQVIGNISLGNGAKDMYYDPAASPGTCGKQNIFNTSTPAQPAACP